MMMLSRAPGSGGKLKSSPEDFVVEEITDNGIVLETGKHYTPTELGIEECSEDEAKFTAFVMQKRDWNTTQALAAVAARLHRTIKSASSAGTKDRLSVSTQLCTIFGVTPKALEGVHLKDISINGAWRAREKIRMGQLKGNRFTVTIREPGPAENVRGVDRELGGVFPNYFGHQRFGARDNNADIGIDIMRGDFDSAAMRYLTDPVNETNVDAMEARKRLQEDHDFARALEYFPQYLKYERMLLGHLAKWPTDCAGALRRLPRNLLLMFVHAVDSRIFNMEVEQRVRGGLTQPVDGDRVCGADSFGFPNMAGAEPRGMEGNGAGGGRRFIVGNVIGYDSEPNESEEDIMERLGITKEMFKVRGMPELNCRGSTRVLFAPYIGMSYELGSEIRIRFSLPAGSYATVLLEEFTKEGAGNLYGTAYPPPLA